MARVKIGDIVEIRTPKGFAYAQYVNKHRKYGALLRVFSGLHQYRPSDMRAVAGGEVQFMCFFPLQAAIKRQVVSSVGRCDVPPKGLEFPVFRAGVVNPKTGKVGVWWLWDGESEHMIGRLSDEQRKLPIRGVWNDTILIERIVSGWRPENDSTT